MIRVGKTALILRGFDQASTLKANELQAGEELISKPNEGNSHDSQEGFATSGGKLVYELVYQ